MTFEFLPGGVLIQRGMDDLRAGIISDHALVVMIGAPRLRSLGLDVPPSEVSDPESRLYQRLSARDPDSAHSRYNALIRQLVSFERALPSGDQ